MTSEVISTHSHTSGVEAPLLLLLLRCPHCAPTQASAVLCAGCGEVLHSPLDGAFNLTSSGMLDWLTLIHEDLKTLLRAQEAA